MSCFETQIMQLAISQLYASIQKDIAYCIPISLTSSSTEWIGVRDKLCSMQLTNCMHQFKNKLHTEYEAQIMRYAIFQLYA